jgi:hypothetical protein
MANILQRLPAMATKAAIGGLGSATESLLGLGNLLTGNRLPSRLPLANLQEGGEIAESIFGKGSTQPGEWLIGGKFPEQVLSKTLENLPLTLATGGSNIPLALARDIAGTVAQTGAEKLGLPASVQLFAGIAGERGFNKALEKWGSKIPPKYLGELAQEAKSEFYSQVEKTGEKIKTDASKYQSKLNEVAEQVSKDTRLSAEDRKKLYRDITQYESDFNKGNISAKDLFNRRTELNDIIANSRGREKFYYQGIKRSLVDELGKQSKLNPKFGKYLSDADAIHDAQNFGNTFKEALRENSILKKVLKNPIAYAAGTLGGSLYLKDPTLILGSALATEAGMRGLRKGTEVYGFLRHEAPRRILQEATDNILKRNIPAAARSYNKLNQLADKYEKQTKSIENKRAAEIAKSQKGLVLRK